VALVLSLAYCDIEQRGVEIDSDAAGHKFMAEMNDEELRNRLEDYL
jgi:hypothetical protein